MRKVTILAVIVFAVCGWLTLPASSDDKKPMSPANIEHDFGTKIVSVRTSSAKTDNQFGFTADCPEKVQVRRLGDRSFLVGQVAGRMGQENPYEGVKLWIPLSTVLELGEFENIEAVDKLIEKLTKPQAPGPATAGGIQ
jgi:hypothetical protein